MNILVIGNGGREHALGFRLKQSERCGKLFFAPGNGGTGALGQNVPMSVDTVDTKTADEVDYFCNHNKIELVVIGPEDPLAQGLADRLAKPGRTIFGPTAAAARLEGDKAYCKQILRSAAIPTAEGRISYGYQWWIPQGAPEGEYMARGIYGQYIYVDSARDVVIATNAADRKFREAGVAEQNIEIFRQIAASLDEES